MGKIKEFSQTNQIVLDVLMNEPYTRNSDNKLFVSVYKRIADAKGIDISNMKVSDFFLKMTSLGFPAVETIRRSRQRIQQVTPELRASVPVQNAREENEQLLRDYFKQ